MHVRGVVSMSFEEIRDFEDYPVYEGPLGFELTASSTIFRLWAPSAVSVTVRIYDEGYFTPAIFTSDLWKKDNGLFEVEIPKNLNNHYYDYLVVTSGKKYVTSDPYAVSAGINGERSMVIDLASTNPEGWDEDRAPEKEDEDIIYELHVKEFTYQRFSGISEENRGHYLGLAERNTHYIDDETFLTGIDYIKSLGVNTVQLMPIYDYGSVDEHGDDDEFNWGYDPVNYNVPEGSYSSDPSDGNVRVRELKTMVKAFHDAGIRVVMDVVYNHTYRLDSALFKPEPWYFYRRNSDGSSSNGSGCGNDLASERPMVHRYILDSIMYWAREYHIDGFRFDLMGLIDASLMMDIREKLDDIYGKGEKLIYGEPWSADRTAAKEGTLLSDKNTLPVMDENIGAFCDATRDIIKGSNFNEGLKGFANGGSTDLTLLGRAVTGWSEGDEHFKVQAPSQTISYASCHDNLTLWDKLCKTMGHDGDYLPLSKNVVKANKLAAGMYFTMMGRPFMLSGEEAARTKLGIENSYRTPIYINRFDWERAYKAKELIEYYKGLISLRKELPCFTDKSVTAKDRLKVFHPISEKTVMFILDDNGGPYDEIMLIYTQETEKFDIPIEGTWYLISDGEKSNRLEHPVPCYVSVPSSGEEVLVLGRNYD